MKFVPNTLVNQQSFFDRSITYRRNAKRSRIVQLPMTQYKTTLQKLLVLLCWPLHCYLLNGTASRKARCISNISYDTNWRRTTSHSKLISTLDCGLSKEASYLLWKWFCSPLHDVCRLWLCLKWLSGQLVSTEYQNSARSLFIYQFLDSNQSQSISFSGLACIFTAILWANMSAAKKPSTFML